MKAQVSDEKQFTNAFVSLLVETQRRKIRKSRVPGVSSVGDVLTSQDYLDRTKRGEMLCKKK